MAMNKRQKEYMSELVCQRLRDDPANEELIQKFVNVVNTNISDALTETGWKSDAEGKLAFYIIKDRELDRPLLFFSLRCGEMHKPMDSEKLLRKVRNSLMLLNEAITVCPYVIYLGSYDPEENKARRNKCIYAQIRAQKVVPNEWAKGVISKQLVDGNLTAKAWGDLWIRVINHLEEQDRYDGDKDLFEKNIVRTKESYPAVELVHFCAYDNVGHKEFPKDWSLYEKQLEYAKDNTVMEQWLKKGMGGNSLGATLFWHFVVPAIQDIRKTAGCEYVYLFAADNSNSKNGPLANHYLKLGFEFKEGLYVTKPIYDFKCFFMCQKIDALQKGKNKFIRAFKQIDETKKTEEPAKV